MRLFLPNDDSDHKLLQELQSTVAAFGQKEGSEPTVGSVNKCPPVEPADGQFSPKIP
jgi:hypothetical protein